MPESLLAPSQIKLFGRKFEGLELKPPKQQEVDPNPVTGSSSAATPATPDPSFDLLANQLVRPESRLARIYGFSFEGEYIALPCPSIFLVHGKGRKIDKNFSGPLDKSGVAVRDFAFEKGIRYWEYDRVNYSMRLDIVSGTLDEILLEACMQPSDAFADGPDIGARSNVISRSNALARSNIIARHRIR